MIKRNIIANYLGQGWAAIMMLALVPFYIRYLGMEAYGLVGLFAVLQSLLSLLDMGLTPALNREMARFTGGAHSAQSIRDLLRSVEVLALGGAGFFAAGTWAASRWLASSWLRLEMLPVETVARAFTIMGVVIALRVVEGIYRSSIVGLQRQILFNVINAIMATLKGLGAVAVLAWVSSTVEAFFIWQGVTAILTVIALAAATYHALPAAERAGRFSLAALRGIGRFAGGMVGITFLALLLTQVDKILLSKLLSLSDYGYYTLAAVVASGLYLLVNPICQACFPRLSELHARNDSAGLIETYHQGAQLVTITMGTAAVVIIIFAETILRLWTQDAELAARTATLLSLLTLGNMLNCFMYIPYQTQLAHGWTGLAMRINIVSVLVILPAILWTTPRFGAQGAAWVWVGLNACYVLIGIHFMYRRILTREKWRWYSQDIFLPLLCAAATAFIVRWMAPAPAHPLGQIAVLAAAAGFTLVSSMAAAPLLRPKIGAFLLRRLPVRKIRTI